MITSERGMLSDGAAGEEVIAPEPVCEIFPSLMSTLWERRARKFEVLCPYSCLIVSIPLHFNTTLFFFQMRSVLRLNTRRQRICHITLK